MTKIKDIILELESWAPLAYQESYDNSGLLTGNSEDQVKGVLITLDITEAVIEEAINQKANLIIAHHPVIFKGLKRLTGTHWVERVVIKAIQNNIALYAIHTNLDHIHTGVNKKIAEKIGLRDTAILQPKNNVLQKLVTFVPDENLQEVLNGIHEAGAGHIGNYSHCSFTTTGTGRFLPEEGANPHIGSHHKAEEVHESRVEVIFPLHLSRKILNALKKSHPYDEVAYYLTDLKNEHQEVGAGMVGLLPAPMEATAFLDHVKTAMDLKVIRHTKLNKAIKKVAVCGGAGSFLLQDAIRQGADAFISGDFKYHECFEADNRLMIMDIGHYESEVFTKDLIYEFLIENFTNFAVNLAKVNTNPIQYY